jgi:hypothetical protein
LPTLATGDGASSAPKSILPENLPEDGRDPADSLNRDCFRHTLDPAAPRRPLESEPASCAELLLMRPNLFSDTGVFVAEAHLDFMAELIRAVQRVAALPAWRERVLARAPGIARYAPKAASVFFGYDFHLDATGPRLIEINTNAGGGLLSARLLAERIARCPKIAGRAADPRRVEDGFVAMFRDEWRLSRGDVPLRCIAIVDETPAEQFLAPEFELFRRLFEAHGVSSMVAAPEELEFDGQVLKRGGRIVDLVYNRLTDFALEKKENAALRAAYLADAVVVTPHPRAHALFADKRNLVALSDEAWLAAVGVDVADRKLLKAGVPRSEVVTPENAAAFWATRKEWFFKPEAGFGGKAAYRGDKLTRRVFEKIAQGGFIAQAVVAPSERRLRVDGAEHRLKLDLRNYVYRGAVQLVSARLYQGQTTNFRTRGGGFAAVFAVGQADRADGSTAS